MPHTVLPCFHRRSASHTRGIGKQLPLSCLYCNKSDLVITKPLDIKVYFVTELEVQRTDNLHSLIAEMERWRGIIGEIYLAERQHKTSYSA